MSLNSLRTDPCRQAGFLMYQTAGISVAAAVAAIVLWSSGGIGNYVAPAACISFLAALSTYVLWKVRRRYRRTEESAGYAVMLRMTDDADEHADGRPRGKMPPGKEA